MKYEKFIEYQRRAHSTVYTEHEGSFHDSAILELAEKFLPDFSLNNDSCILDIGCGPGLFLSAARQLGFHNITGVTLSQNDFEICKSKGFKCFHTSMSDIDLPDQSVDLIWCRHALEHSVYPLFTLYEFARLIKPSGKIFIEVPAPDNDRAFIHEYNPNHYSILGERMWDGLFEKAGLALVNDYIYNMPVSYENKVVQEKSYIFILKSDAEDIAAKFFRKYGIKID